MVNAGSGIGSAVPARAPERAAGAANGEFDVETLAAGDVVRVRTRNSEYVIRVVDGRSGHATIEGGSVFPVPAMVEVVGSGGSTGCPTLGRRIRVGQALLLLHCGAWVRTGTVRSVGLERAVASEVRKSLPPLC